MARHSIYHGVDFETFDCPVGALVSGGVDSALMLYFLLRYHRQPLHLFTLANGKRMNRNAKAALDVISRCAELTGNYGFTHHVRYARVQDRENLFDLPSEFLGDDRIGYVYTGVTSNPPAHVVSRFRDENTEDASRSPSHRRPLIVGRYYRPWTNLDKSDIAKIYEHHGLIDSLYKHTRSCEWDSEEMHGPDPGPGHCGRCWWCEERIWGFGTL